MQIPSIKKVLDPELISKFESGNIDKSIDIIAITTSPLYKSPSLYEEFFETDKKYVQFVKKIESIVRSSPEMRRYMSYLKSNLDLNECSVLKGVNLDNARIELHHYPFTLYDITHIIIQYKIANKIKYSTIELAEEIVHLHYQNVIGLIPVSETVHDLAHAGEVFLPLQDVYGNYKKFIIKYNAGIPSEYFDMLKKLVELSNEPDALSKNSHVLEIRPIIWQLTNEGKPINASESTLAMLPNPLDNLND